jgi:CubicO group peptidase (beta-lactamase class C family)
VRARQRLRSVLAATFAVLVGVGAAACTAPEGDEVRAQLATDVDKRTLQSDALIRDLVAPDRPGCSAAVAQRGQVRWAGAVGIADLETREPLDIETRFDIASASKQFTATAVLVLQREGLLDLGDPIADYVAGLPAWGETVTLDQLLHHTSRVREYWPVLEADGIDFADVVSHAEIVRAIARQRTLEPGSGYVYSNSNYVLLAEAVHRVSGLALPEFLAERVFGPLALEFVLNPNLRAADIALSYDVDDVLVTSGWAAYGPSGIVATPSELARWADQYRTGPIVSADLAVGAVDTGEGRYAAGIRIADDGSLRHDGRIGGYISTFQVSADRLTAVVVMCNGHGSDRFGIADGLWAIWGSAAARAVPE